MISLALPSTPESVTRAVESSEREGRRLGLSDEAISRVGLAVAEAVANAIEHGNQADKALKVRVGIAPEEHALRVTVSDEGDGVTRERIVQASLPDDPLQPDGRGLYLIRELSDRVTTDASTLCLWFTDRA